jgi:hypothetical protein
MLTLGNVHKVVPKGANRGLNGNSVQLTGVAWNPVLALLLNLISLSFYGLLLRFISIRVKALLFVLGNNNRS